MIYGIAMAALFGLLKYIEYSYFVRDIPLEIYVGVVALGFAVLGIWAGTRLARPKTIEKKVIEEKVVEVERPAALSIDEAEVNRLGISKREYEVLELIAQGMSNQEIAEHLFVSNSTVKTHTSNLFSKLDARRRTQAVQIAKELRIIR